MYVKIGEIVLSEQAFSKKTNLCKINISRYAQTLKLNNIIIYLIKRTRKLDFRTYVIRSPTIKHFPVNYGRQILIISMQINTNYVLIISKKKCLKCSMGGAGVTYVIFSKKWIILWSVDDFVKSVGHFSILNRNLEYVLNQIYVIKWQNSIDSSIINLF